MKRLKIFTWHVHGNYLYYLSQCDHELYIPVAADNRAGYGGRGRTFPFGPNVHEVTESAVPELGLDCVIFQSRQNYEVDQFRTLSAAQRALPRLYLEHDPPRTSPVDTCHPMDDPAVLLVHVTHFNALMWDSGTVPTTVIEHGVIVDLHGRFIQFDGKGQWDRAYSADAAIAALNWVDAKRADVPKLHHIRETQRIRAEYIWSPTDADRARVMADISGVRRILYAQGSDVS